MKKDTQDTARFSAAMAKCALAYSKNITDQHFELYWDLLADKDINDVEAAFVQHMKSSKFFPTVAEIIELIPDRPFIAADGKMYVKSGDRLLRVHGPVKQLAKVQS